MKVSVGQYSSIALSDVDAAEGAAKSGDYFDLRAHYLRAYWMARLAAARKEPGAGEAETAVEAVYNAFHQQIDEVYHDPQWQDATRRMRQLIDGWSEKVREEAERAGE